MAGLFFWLSQNNAFAANPAIVSYSSRSYAFLPAQVAVAQNFFRDENLEALLIQMRSQVTVPALISGEVQYTLSFGNIIGSAMQGLPFKILAVLTDKPLHSLVGRPEIKSISELRGKRIGTQRIGGSDQLAAEAILQAKGIDPKEVQFVTLGGDEPVRVEILKKGLVDAICTVPPGPVRLSREGYNVLGGPKDLKIGNPISAIAVTDARLKSSREETKKVVRAILRGLRFMHERKEQTVQIMGRWLNQRQNLRIRHRVAQSHRTGRSAGSAVSDTRFHASEGSSKGVAPAMIERSKLHSDFCHADAKSFMILRLPQI